MTMLTALLVTLAIMAFGVCCWMFGWDSGFAFCKKRWDEYEIERESGHRRWPHLF